MEKVYSWEKYDRKTEYCENEIEMIDLWSWECIRELELCGSRFTVEDAFREMWEGEE